MKLLSLLFILSLKAYSSPIKLFSQNGMPVEKYDELVVKIATGDQIQFTNGEVFTIKEKLGSGDNFIVFSVLENSEFALRLVKSKYNIDEVDQYYKALSKVINLQLPAIKLLAYQPGQWIATKLISSRMSLASFIKEISYYKKNQIYGQQVDDILLQLRFFLLELGKFRKIGDLHEENILFDFESKTWLIIDLKNELLGLRYLDDTTALSFMTESYGYIKNRVFYNKKDEHQWLGYFLTEVLSALSARHSIEIVHWSCERVLLQ